MKKSEKSSGITKFIQNFAVKEKHDVNLKTPENAMNICISILHVFNDIDSSDAFAKQSQSIIKNIKTPRRFQRKGTDSLLGNKGALTLRDADKRFLYFILSTSSQEFHKSYLEFYYNLAQKTDFSIDEQAFYSALSYLCRKEVVGKNKIVKCFHEVAAAAYLRGSQLDGLINSFCSDDEIGPNVAKEMFNVLKLQTNSSDQAGMVIDYLKFFPIALALFSEDVKKKISKREHILTTVSGVEKDGTRVGYDDKSLVYKFESAGFKYRQNAPEALAMQDIEKTLLLFRNSCSDEYDFKQINICLSEIQKKYKFNTRLLTFKKQPKLDHKFLRYLAYLICMHSSCSKLGGKGAETQSMVIEEYILWNAVLNAEKKLDDGYIRSSLDEFASKKKIDDNSPEDKLREFCSTYIKKIIPSIQKQSLSSIVGFLFENYKNFKGNALSFLANNIYDALIDESHNKLMGYIKSNYEKFLPKMEGLFRKSSPGELMQNSKGKSDFSMGSKILEGHSMTKKLDITIKEDQELETSHLVENSKLHSSMHEMNSPVIPLSDRPRRNSMTSNVEKRSETLLKSHQREKQLARSVDSNINMSMHSERGKLKDNSKGSRSFTMGSPDRFEPNQNIEDKALKACYIMEYFLHQYSKTKSNETTPLRSPPSSNNHPSIVKRSSYNAFSENDEHEKSKARSTRSLKKVSIEEKKPKSQEREMERERDREFYRNREREKENIPETLRPLELEDFDERLSNKSIQFENLVFLRKSRPPKKEQYRLCGCDCNQNCNLM